MTRGHVLITGGAGFIGSHLTDELLERGYEVTILDALLPQVHADGDNDADGWPTYLDPRARRIRGNILDDGVFEGALDGITHLVHLAASVGVGQSMTNIVDYTRNNVMSAAIMLEALSKMERDAEGNHPIRRIAVASSMSIYGEGEYESGGDRRVAPGLRSHEQLAGKHWELADDTGRLRPVPTSEAKLLEPASIYAVNKRDHEEMFLSVGRALGIPTGAMRLFNVYGSRQALSNPYTGVAAIFISRLLNDQPPLVFEDGEQRRDFVHVSDVSRAFATFLDSDLAIWDAFNVGSGGSITVNEMARTLARLLHKNIAPEILEKYRVGDIRHCFSDVSKIRSVLGFEPKRRFDEGMAELIEWVRTARKPVDRSTESLAELDRSKLVV
jgi:dTDP-L-rhamnose 4-epimerase